MRLFANPVLLAILASQKNQTKSTHSATRAAASINAYTGAKIGEDGFVQPAHLDIPESDAKTLEQVAADLKKVEGFFAEHKLVLDTQGLNRDAFYLKNYGGKPAGYLLNKTVNLTKSLDLKEITRDSPFASSYRMIPSEVFTNLIPLKDLTYNNVINYLAKLLEISKEKLDIFSLLVVTRIEQDRQQLFFIASTDILQALTQRFPIGKLSLAMANVLYCAIEKNAQLPEALTPKQISNALLKIGVATVVEADEKNFKVWYSPTKAAADIKQVKQVLQTRSKQLDANMLLVLRHINFKLTGQEYKGEVTQSEIDAFCSNLLIDNHDSPPTLIGPESEIKKLAELDSVRIEIPAFYLCLVSVLVKKTLDPKIVFTSFLEEAKIMPKGYDYQFTGTSKPLLHLPLKLQPEVMTYMDSVARENSLLMDDNLRKGIVAHARKLGFENTGESEVKNALKFLKEKDKIGNFFNYSSQNNRQYILLNSVDRQTISCMASVYCNVSLPQVLAFQLASGRADMRAGLKLMNVIAEVTNWDGISLSARPTQLRIDSGFNEFKDAISNYMIIQEKTLRFLQENKQDKQGAYLEYSVEKQKYYVCSTQWFNTAYQKASQAPNLSWLHDNSGGDPNEQLTQARTWFHSTHTGCEPKQLLEVPVALPSQTTQLSAPVKTSLYKSSFTAHLGSSSSSTSTTSSSLFTHSA